MPKTGKSKAAREQEKAQAAQIELARETYDIQRELLDPYRQAGLQHGLTGLEELSSLEGQDKYYQDYYKSGQFQTQADAARGQQLAASEATGGVQGSSAANQLARISPTLGLQALERQQNLAGQLTNIGLSGAGSQAAYQGQSTAAQAGALQNLGNIGAAKAQAGYQNILGGIGVGLQGFGAYKTLKDAGKF